MGEQWSCEIGQSCGLVAARVREKSMTCRFEERLSTCSRTTPNAPTYAGWSELWPRCFRISAMRFDNC
jgi:hypothetical protein